MVVIGADAVHGSKDLGQGGPMVAEGTGRQSAPLSEAKADRDQATTRRRGRVKQHGVAGEVDSQWASFDRLPMLEVGRR